MAVAQGPCATAKIHHSGDIKQTSVSGPSFEVTVLINNIPIQVLLDTGSCISIIPIDVLEDVLKMRANPLTDIPELKNSKFVTANGDDLNFLGYTDANVKFQGNIYCNSTFLVVPTSRCNSVLIRTNILSLLDGKDMENGDGYFASAVKIVDNLLNNYNIVWSSKRICKIAKSLTKLDTVYLWVKLVLFARTVLLTPTDKASSIKGISFGHICFEIPKNSDKVEIPFLVTNLSDRDTHISRYFPLYNVSPVERIVNNIDPVKEIPSDEEFLKIVNIDKEKLSKEELHHAYNLLLKHKHIFAFNEYQLGCMNDVEFKIDPIDKTPVSHRYRPIHPKYQERVQEKLKVLLETGVISETTGPWNSPLTVVEKSAGELRLCIDYRSLNKQCRRDAKPIPRIEETLALLQGNTMFSTVDMMSGYYQLPLAEDSKMCIAFSAGSGKLYKFNRMSFGYTGSGGFFQCSVENVLADILYSRSLVYLDDVLVLGKSFDNHCTSLDMVLSRLYDAGIRLKLKKCKFFTNETNYLGHIISDKGIKPNPEKTRAIEQWKKPTNIKDIRQFHGLISYYRKFIPNFARRAAPLTDLMKGKRVSRGKRQVFVPCKFDWTHMHDKAFEDLKKALLEEVCLAHQDFNSNFILELDASRSGLGAVLSQRINGELRPIAFASRKTSVTCVFHSS